MGGAVLTTDELRALIAGGESDRVEFTVSTTNTDKFGEAICAFANDFPDRRRPDIYAVQDCYRDFERLAKAIAAKCDVRMGADERPATLAGRRP